MSGLRAAVAAVRSVAHLVWYPITLAESQALLRRRAETRVPRFLALVERLIYGNPRSPYRALLQHAACSFADLRALVSRHGLEGALGVLRDAGVYLSFEEFKGRVPVQRAGRTFVFRPEDFDNPRGGAAAEIRTSASRSAGTPVSVTFDYVAAQRAPAWALTLAALGAADCPVVIWMPAVTHGGGLMWWLALLHLGRPARRWFALVDPARDVTTRHRAMFRAAALVAGLRRGRVALPEHAGFAGVERVLDAVLDARGGDGACAVISSPSAATRLATAARDSGADLERVVFLVGGEPLTPGKAAEIRRSGARVGTMYVLSEAGAVAGACGHPLSPDDMHFHEDSFALVPRRRTVPDGGPVEAFMLSSLLESAPKVLLNVETDDFGERTTRRCGCVFDEVGQFQHLSAIRSFSKLTGEGVTVLGTDCVRVLEEVLPREFGGSSIDYQLLEVEDEHSLTRLLLVVSPAVGALDTEAVRARFVAELRRIGPRGVLPPLWLQAETIRVVRRPPVATAGGKILPFHTLVGASPVPVDR